MSRNEKEKLKDSVRFTLDMETDIHKEFKIAAVGEGVSMRELALRFIREGIDKINQTAKRK